MEDRSIRRLITGVERCGSIRSPLEIEALQWPGHLRRRDQLVAPDLLFKVPADRGKRCTLRRPQRFQDQGMLNAET